MSPKDAQDFIDGIIDDEDPNRLTVSSEVHDALADGGPAHGAIRYGDVNIYRDPSLGNLRLLLAPSAEQYVPSSWVCLQRRLRANFKYTDREPGGDDPVLRLRQSLSQEMTPGLIS